MLIYFLPLLIALSIYCVGYITEKYLIQRNFYFNNKFKIYDLGVLYYLSKVINFLIFEEGIFGLFLNFSLFLMFFLVSFFVKRKARKSSVSESDNNKH